MPRRDLRFKTFEDVRAELSRLGEDRLETTGLWSYAQILTHCAVSLENTLKGTRPEMSWWVRRVKGPLFYWRNALAGRIPEGVKGNPQTTPDKREEGDDRAAFARLLKALEDLEKFEGPLSWHRRFGALTKAQWIRFHSMHIANHLGHARPRP